MKAMKKIVALLLLMTMALSLCSAASAAAKFTKKEVASGVFVKFTGTMYGYNKPNSKSKSNIAVKKGSVGLLIQLSGSKWGKVVITDGSMNADDKEKDLWFNLDKLARVKDQSAAYIRCVFSSGGSNLSMKDGKLTIKSLNGKKIVTNGKVNLRKTGSLQGKSQGTVKKGVKLTCTGKIAYDTRLVLFFQVKYNGKKLYVSSEYIKNYQDIILKALEEEIGI